MLVSFACLLVYAMLRYHPPRNGRKGGVGSCSAACVRAGCARREDRDGGLNARRQHNSTAQHSTYQTGAIGDDTPTHRVPTDRPISREHLRAGYVMSLRVCDVTWSGALH